jgi:hypothetical protein
LDADGGVVAAVDLATSSYVGSDFSG